MNSVIFNEERFQSSDKPAKEATKKLFEKIHPEWTLIENPNRYGIDYIVYSNGKLIAYIECELSNKGFDEKGFKYSEIRLLPRKNHFLEYKDSDGRALEVVPIYICTISKDCDQALIYEISTMRTRGRIIEGCVNYVPGQGHVEEDMRALSVLHCKAHKIEKTG